MLASSAGDAPLTGERLVYEPKYDGVRALALIEPPGRVVLWSRLGNDKTAQFPEVVRELTRFAKGLKAPLLLDGELVALDARGEPTSFQHLQGRLHLKDVRGAGDGVAAFVVFDLLRDGADDLRSLPLVARRARLERVFSDTGSPLLRLSEQAGADGRDLYRRAMAAGWEGLIAKRADSRYLAGKRTHDWIKLKLTRVQEFVVGGWTAPRGARAHLGALIVGVYEKKRLVYAGHVGSGFDDRELARLMKLLQPIEIPACPFVEEPPSNDTPHWVRPELVAEVKFTEWTDEARLRHPTYLGLRDDVRPKDVRREPAPRLNREAIARLGDEPAPAAPLPPRRTSATRRQPGRSTPAKKTTKRKRSPAPSGITLTPDLALLIDQLDALEEKGGKGTVVLPDGDRLQLGNLDKVFWPREGLTKGDLLRYYVRVSPCLLPVVADRPLVMKRFPEGVTGQTFYQQRAPDPVPPGVRVEVLEEDDEVPSRVIGGSLKTLLHITQLAAISQDPWFSRVGSTRLVDHVAFDLDPMPGVPFASLLDVAQWVRDELDRIGAEAYPKTSGSDGLHVYVPMPPGTPYEAGLIFAQIVATVVAAKHPKIATVERVVQRRGPKVYVDYLQNIHGKTLACAYSARASEFAGASTPLTWDEIAHGIDRRDFTIRTLPARLAEVGDLWGPLLTSPGVDLRRVEKLMK